MVVRGGGGREEAVCDNVVDFQMQRTSFAFQNGCSGIFWLSLFVADSLSASTTPLLSLSLSLTPSFSLFLLISLSFALKLNWRLPWPAAASLSCIKLQLAYIAHTPRWPTKLADCKYLYGFKWYTWHVCMCVQMCVCVCQPVYQLLFAQGNRKLCYSIKITHTPGACTLSVQCIYSVPLHCSPGMCLTVCMCVCVCVWTDKPIKSDIHN